ncbi:MAG: efflux RND transporter permease subunit [Bacteroidales bacterium]|nr:efflux RND transporter permease subunit [Bacteroidales bacterium]
MMLGLVAKNAILIVDFANHLKTTGLNTTEALLQAVKTRFRPILMTTLALVFGMIPIAIASGAGAEWKMVWAGCSLAGLPRQCFSLLLLCQ